MIGNGKPVTDVDLVLGAMKADGYVPQSIEESKRFEDWRYRLISLENQIKFLREDIATIRKILAEIPSNDAFRQLRDSSLALTERSNEWRLRQVEKALAALPEKKRKGRP